VAKKNTKINRCCWPTDIPNSHQTCGMAAVELRTNRLSVILQDFSTSNIN